MSSYINLKNDSQSPGAIFFETFCEKFKNRIYMIPGQKQMIRDLYYGAINDAVQNTEIYKVKEIKNPDEYIKKAIVQCIELNKVIRELPVKRRRLFYELKRNLITVLRLCTKLVKEEFMETNHINRNFVCYKLYGYEDDIFRIPATKDYLDTYYRGTVKRKRLGTPRDYTGVETPSDKIPDKEHIDKMLSRFFLLMMIVLFRKDMSGELQFDLSEI